MKTTKWRPLGYGLVASTALLLGALGIVPFLILGYAVSQWVLAPLDLTVVDSSNNDGPLGLVVAGVLLPLAIASGCAALVWWLSRRFALRRRWSWSLAVVALVLPVVLFVLVRTT